MADGTLKRIEINVDCGEGFGRWKMVRRDRIHVLLEVLPDMDLCRDLTKN